MQGQVRRLVAAGLIYTLGVVSVAFGSYMLEHKRIIEDIDARLFAAASNLPSLLPADFHDVARSREAVSVEQDEKNLELLTQHAKTSAMTYIYSYVMVDGEIYFTTCNYTQADIENDQVVTYWTDYPEGAPEYYQAMNADEPIYVTAGDRWGMFRTILMPMKSPGGLPYVAAADMDITIIEQALLRNILTVLGLSLLLIFLVIPLVWAYNRTYSEMNRKLQALNEQLQEDIAKAQVLEKELKQANQLAEQASQVKSQFLSNMSHELRTPINGIVGTNQLLMTTHLDEEQHELLEICTHSAQVLLDTVNQILDTAAIEADGIVLKPRPVQCSQFFEELVKMFSASASESKLDLIIDVAPSLPEYIVVDDIRLRQVFINLIANALKFTRVGGVKVVLDWNQGMLNARVEDTGIGIPAESQSLVFEMFQQVDSSNSRSHEGTGLGLSIASKICQLMQGKLELLHSDDQGSAFGLEVCAPEAPKQHPMKQWAQYQGDFDAVIAPGLLADWFKTSLQRTARVHNELSQVDPQAALPLVYDADLGWQNLIDFVSSASGQRKVICLIWPGVELPAELRDKVGIIRKPFTGYGLLKHLC